MPSPSDPLRYDLAHRDTQVRRAVREALRRERLTQRWLAAQVGWSPQYVSRKLTGLVVLRPKDLERFLTAMECEVIETPRGPVVVKCRTVVV